MASDVMELLRDVPLSQPLTPTPTAGAAASSGVPPVSPYGSSSSPAGRSRRLERLHMQKKHSALMGNTRIQFVRPDGGTALHAEQAPLRQSAGTTRAARPCMTKLACISSVHSTDACKAAEIRSCLFLLQHTRDVHQIMWLMSCSEA
jgi:hypothetical protein